MENPVPKVLLPNHTFVRSCSVCIQGTGWAMAGVLRAESCVTHVQAVGFHAAHPTFMFLSHHQLMRWNLGEGPSLCKIGNLFDSVKVIGIIGGALMWVLLILLDIFEL